MCSTPSTSSDGQTGTTVLSLWDGKVCLLDGDASFTLSTCIVCWALFWEGANPFFSFVSFCEGKPFVFSRAIVFVELHLRARGPDAHALRPFWSLRRCFPSALNSAGVLAAPASGWIGCFGGGGRLAAPLHPPRVHSFFCVARRVEGTGVGACSAFPFFFFF